MCRANDVLNQVGAQQNIVKLDRFSTKRCIQVNVHVAYDNDGHSVDSQSVNHGSELIKEERIRRHGARPVDDDQHLLGGRVVCRHSEELSG